MYWIPDDYLGNDKPVFLQKARRGWHYAERNMALHIQTGVIVLDYTSPTGRLNKYRKRCCASI